MKKLFITTFIILTVITKLTAQSFSVDNLNYSVNNDGVSVTVTGYIDDMEPLVIPESVSHNGYDYTINAIGQNAFNNYYWNGQDELVVPNSVTNIGNYAFAYSNCGKHLILSNSLTYIGNYAFYHCNFKDELVIPNTVNHIGDWAFAFCARFSGDLYIPDAVTYLGEGAFTGCGQIRGSLHLSNSLETIRDNTFDQCKFTGILTIPNTVNSIGNSAFGGCSGFTGSLIFPNSVSHIGEDAFSGCTNFDGELVLPDSLSIINDGTFHGCENLSGTLNIPNTVTYIGFDAFAYCGFTGPLNIPENVTYIGIDAFSYCNFTGSLTIPDSVIEIDNHAFYQCSGFSGELVIGKSVSLIGSWAFAYCTGISEVISLATTPPELTFSNAFQYTDCTTLTVPCGFLDIYEQNSSWNQQFTTITENCNYLTHPEWYYELINDSGDITYQYLSHQGDTTIQHKKVKIIVKTNTLYDKESIEQTEEYIYVEDNKVYWWNQTIEEFTVLYDFGAQVGDYWEIKAGHNSIVVHVDMVGQAEYDGIVYKTLQISDYDDMFGGTIVCTVGHLTSFFPEKMLDNKGNCEVNGLRCHWNDGELLFKVGNVDCDYIFVNHHLGVDETDFENGFIIYPNPSHGIIYLETFPETSQNHEYRIINILGETVLSGKISAYNQMIDVSNLPNGIYFMKIREKSTMIGEKSTKIIIEK